MSHTSLTVLLAAPTAAEVSKDTTGQNQGDSKLKVFTAYGKMWLAIYEWGIYTESLGEWGFYTESQGEGQHEDT